MPGPTTRERLQKIDLMLSGHFVIPLNKLANNSLASTLGKVKKKGGVSIETIATHFALKNSLVKNVTCALAPDGKNLLVDMHSILTGEIDESYLGTFLEVLDDAFKVLFLGARNSDASDA